MAILGEKELDSLNDIRFLESYLRLLNTRLVYSNNIIEQDAETIGKLYDSDNADSLKDNLDAFSILLKKVFSPEERPLTIDLIKQVADTINANAKYISLGFRKIDAGVAFEDKYPIEKAENIEKAMQNLLDNYYGPWKQLDVFEREARFNIEFLRIHPFEDGNGRTSRLILNFNMLRQRHAPILMPESIREEYFHARNEEDITWVRNLFERESEKELGVLDRLIEKENQKSLDALDEIIREFAKSDGERKIQ